MWTGAEGSHGSRARPLEGLTFHTFPNGISAQVRCPGREVSSRVSAATASNLASSHFRLPDDGWRYRAGGRPSICNLGCCRCHRAFDVAVGSAAKSAGFDALCSGHGFLEELVQKLAERKRVKRERLVRFLGRLPAETVGPQIAEGIPKAASPANWRIGCG